MPSKEVGHDTQRGLVVPMGVSSSELSGSVGRRWLGQFVCVARGHMEAPSSSYRR